MAPVPPAAPVIHQPERQRFLCSAAGQDAVFEYRLLPGGRVDFHHTFVPESLRGRGIAEALVRAGFAWARAAGLQIEASCWYAARWLRAEPGGAPRR
jgi:hypothetical protein